MGKTPFEIRLELLKMAKEMLEHDYFTKKDVILDEWRHSVSRAMDQQTPFPSIPLMPTFPSTDVVIEKAKVLNTFVSNS